MFRDLLDVLERIVRHPLYYLIGVARDRLVYQSTQEGSNDLWVSDLDGSNNVLLAREVLLVARPRREDRRIYYTLDVSGGRELAKVFYVDVSNGDSGEAFNMEPLRIFGLTYMGDTVIYSGVSREDNTVYISEGGGDPEKVFSTDKWVFTVDYDGRYIVGAGTLAGNPRSFEVFIYDREANEAKIYTPRDGSTNMPAGIHEGRILLTSDYGGEKELYIYDIESGELSKPTLSGGDYRGYVFQDYSNYGFTDDGRVWFIGLQDYRGYAFLDGYRVSHPDGTPDNLCLIGEYIYFTFSNLKTPHSILRARIGGGGWERVIGRDLDRDILNKMGRVNIVKYKSFDGLEIPTIIFESSRGRPGPSILYVHGGPWSHVGDFWSILIPSLVASGYHVIAPNFRGSTGYGEDFRRLDIGDPGGGDLKDIIYAREYAFKAGLSNRIAIMGYSYGGFMTYLATVKEPDLWDAGVAGAGVTDWRLMYELADAAFKHFQEILFDGRRVELWDDRSPINFAERLKAPLCIIHPQNDTRTPLKPVLKYMERLLEYGKRFEAHIIPDMGHIITRVDDMLKLVYPAIIFLKRVLG